MKGNSGAIAMYDGEMRREGAPPGSRAGPSKSKTQLNLTSFRRVAFLGCSH